MKIAALFAVAGLAAVANAGVVVFTFPLSGLQEVPAVITPASGTMTLTLDDVTGNFTLDYSFSDLKAGVTVAHFHRNVAGANGPVVYWLAATGAPNALPTTLMSPSLPTGVTAASGTGTGTFSSTLIDDAKAGRLYANIHTTAHAGGELRGQVVPAPAGLALAGLVGLAAGRRRR